MAASTRLSAALEPVSFSRMRHNEGTSRLDCRNFQNSQLPASLVPDSQHKVKRAQLSNHLDQQNFGFQARGAPYDKHLASVTRCEAAATGRQESKPSEPAAKGGPAEGPATPFHLAFPVNDLEATREFYGRVLGCPEGRSADTWIDYNLFGHQIVCHLIPGYNGASTANPVDGDPVPVPHFGLAMTQPDFHALASRVRTAGIPFVIEPHLRFKGAPGEQWTMFFRDPSGNSLEFKAMTNPNNLFAKYKVDS